ncbi:MAG TPA: DUF3866 family protein [Actinomycetota bacterium]|nr:DUF3866 family protein [Actinomycetota bacterium]
MVRLRWGTVVGVAVTRPGAVELRVSVEGAQADAIAYPDLVGPVAAGDRVLLNTTAVALGLGTGGFSLVVAVDGPAQPSEEPAPGRVMKARYLPLQTQVSSVEETHGEQLEASEGLRGTPVVVAPLHSLIAPVAAGARAAGAERVVYVMTDQAALPGPLSRLVPRLREAGMLGGFVTAGQSFGGDLEAVTVWTGLLAAVEVLGADVVVVADGPGNLGTNTRWGVSALAAGNSMNAAHALGGRPVAALRVSFADERERHRGVSHHSLTILADVCLVPATVAVPALAEPERTLVWDALRAAHLEERHQLVEGAGETALDALREAGVAVESMGRTPEDDPAFFLAGGAAGILAGRMAAGNRRWRASEG